MPGQAIASAADLPKLVGYKQLHELYGWPKRTVQEWMKRRKFPRPLDLPGRENYWALDDILDWLKGDLLRVAVTRPEELTHDQLQDATLELLVRSVEEEIGEPIDPAGLRVSYGLPRVRVSEVQLGQAEDQEAALWQERFAHHDAARSCVIAAWLFPELRQMFADGAINDSWRKVLLDSKRLQSLALCALSAIPNNWEAQLKNLNAGS